MTDDWRQFLDTAQTIDQLWTAAETLGRPWLWRSGDGSYNAKVEVSVGALVASAAYYNAPTACKALAGSIEKALGGR